MGFIDKIGVYVRQPRERWGFQKDRALFTSVFIISILYAFSPSGIAPVTEAPAATIVKTNSN